MRITIPRVHGDTPKEKIVRSIALVLVFAAVVWGFMKNNEHVVEVLNRDSSVYDETKTLDKDQRKFIASFVKTMKDEYGITCKVQVYGGDFGVPDLDSKTMFIGIAPAINVAELRFPPMMRTVLGEPFIESLSTDFLLPSFENGDWPMAIQEVLVSIFQKLESMNKDDKTSE